MTDSYFSLSALREFWRYVEHAPYGKGGFYYKSSQKKRRKMWRRVGKGRLMK